MGLFSKGTNKGSDTGRILAPGLNVAEMQFIIAHSEKQEGQDRKGLQDLKVLAEGVGISSDRFSIVWNTQVVGLRDMRSTYDSNRQKWNETVEGMRAKIDEAVREGGVAPEGILRRGMSER